MAQRLTPPIQARGLYELKLPFEADPTTIYVCKAIRTFQDIQEQYLNPYDLYYAPNGLAESDYKSDRDDNACIVTLIDDEAEEILYVPDTYILSYPNMGEVNYHHLVLSVDFGPIPDYLEFQHVIEQIGSIAFETIGKEPEVGVHSAPYNGVITPEQHDTMEAARRANILRNNTWYALYKEKENQLNNAQQKLDTLEQILIDINGP